MWDHWKGNPCIDQSSLNTSSGLTHSNKIDMDGHTAKRYGSMTVYEAVQKNMHLLIISVEEWIKKDIYRRQQKTQNT